MAIIGHAGIRNACILNPRLMQYAGAGLVINPGIIYTLPAWVILHNTLRHVHAGMP